jgi:hypothetical protein
MNMAKIINLPTLRKWTEHDQQELLIQLLEMREKLTNVVDLASDQEQTTDLRQRLYNELMPSKKSWRMPLKWFGQLTRKKNDQGLDGNAGSADLGRHPNVWAYGPGGAGSAAATLNGKECRHQVE